MMKWELLEKQLLFEKVGKFWQLRLRFEKHKGGFSNLCQWYVLQKGGATAGLLFDPNSKNVLLVKQFRPMCIFFPEDEQHSWMNEIVAGSLLPGEDPKHAFFRECKEEVGLSIQQAELIYQYYPSPGVYGERVSLFYAEFDQHKLVTNAQGLEKENEDTLPVLFPIAEIPELLRQGFFVDSKTIMALQWLLLNKNT